MDSKEFKKCTSDYSKCDFSCDDKTFTCINEIRRRDTAELIRTDKYPFAKGWDFTPSYKPEHFLKGKKRKKKKKLKHKPSEQVIQNLKIPEDQMGLNFVHGKGYPFTLTNGDVVHVLFLVRGNIRDILERDKKCLKCPSTIRLTKDHIIPKSKGGGSGKKNLQILCLKCNSKKGNTLPDESEPGFNLPKAIKKLGKKWMFE